ncbi:GntR family transcriptional regulator [Bacillus sp. JJ1764]|uniref:GntR family transcriptional regulator n=1 Tax=Bacillus sp. JJ1764 TaxID=3122964 RepID=UPI002FFEFED3
MERPIINTTPMHIQLRDLLWAKIESGEWGSGEAIPSERELAAIYGLNRTTVRYAIQGLVDEGVLKKVQGKGTFVKDQKIATRLNELVGFSKVMQEKGHKPSTKLLFSGKRRAAFKYSEIFKIDKDDWVYRIVRLRLVDGDPYSIEDAYIPMKYVPGIEKVDFQVISLYEFFAQNGIILSQGKELLNVVKVRNSEAKLLQIPVGSPVYLSKYISQDQEGRRMEYLHSYSRSDKISLSIEFD